MINLQWGTQKNGQIDSSLLIDVSGRGDYLEPTAAVQWRRMVAACAAATGVTLRPASGSSAYRPVAIQQQFYANYLKYGSPVAAVPGTSNHGWARAVDITGYEGNTIWRSPRTGTKYAVNLTVWNWLQAHAGEYGYGWATGDSSGEAWHWESLTAAGTSVAGGSSSTLTEGWLMALTDAEQRELLENTRAIITLSGMTKDAIFKGVVAGQYADPTIKLDGRSTLPGGLLVMASMTRDATLNDATQGAPRDGAVPGIQHIQATLKKITDKLGITTP